MHNLPFCSLHTALGVKVKFDAVPWTIAYGSQFNADRPACLLPRLALQQQVSDHATEAKWSSSSVDVSCVDAGIICITCTAQ